jgi:hypothetical protein
MKTALFLIAILMVTQHPVQAQSATVKTSITVVDPKTLDVTEAEATQGMDVMTTLWKTKQCCLYRLRPDLDAPGYCLEREMVSRVEESIACEVLR